VAKPDTILAWYRRLIAQEFDGSRHRGYPGRPRVSSEIEALVVRMAREIHHERNRQGRGNLLLFPTGTIASATQATIVRCYERLGGLLKYYSRAT
jgi:hypothetical protein